MYPGVCSGDEEYTPGCVVGTRSIPWVVGGTLYSGWWEVPYTLLVPLPACTVGYMSLPGPLVGGPLPGHHAVPTPHGPCTDMCTPAVLHILHF